jgi:hypothetical protein
MFDDNAYLRWLDQCGFSDPARALLTDIRRSPPVRRVAGGRGNIHGRYPSRKMGCTIQLVNKVKSEQVLRCRVSNRREA